ncbi:hypothetical protein [Halosegnis sp.]|uniref:hypothetical protein n=1 Tax=Halosegnis sp. TaxID=2864959 RepID=UPI0035D52577
MAHVPDALDTDRGPPMAVPLGHFLVALGFLLAAGVVGVVDTLGTGTLQAAYRHLLLVGWLCLTIMGAMTQFVPVWSGRQLYSRRLARWQLWLVAVGVAGLAVAVGGRPGLAPVAGLPLLVGFWAFAYNLGRTLPPLRACDIVEGHFALALAALVGASTLGYTLALDAQLALLGALPVARAGVVAAHATLAGFGVVVTTVLGALAQLGPMFTGASDDALDARLRRLETVAYPLGVGLLTIGRLVAVTAVARAGGLLLLCGLTAAVGTLARHVATAAERSPMVARYAVAAVALLAWAVTTLPAWLAAPLARATLFGASPALLWLGGVGFIVVGTLYHVVPFIVWEHRYAARLGLDPVPGIDDLYDGRLARADWVVLTGGVLLRAGAEMGLPAPAGLAGWVALVGGAGLLAVNLGLVVRDHGRRSVAALLAGSDPAEK